MPQSVHSQHYELFLAQLRAARLGASLTQGELARRMGNTQTFVSKCERGERRLDVIDLIAFLDAIGQSPSQFIATLDVAVKAQISSARSGWH